jgi:hypothetical protein
MALNKFFNTQVLYNSTDITDYCSFSENTVLNRNLDHSQVFSKITLKISEQIGASSSIAEGDLITIDQEDTRNYFKVLEVDKQASFTDAKLVNIFENLKNERFLTFDGSSYEPNSLLSAYLDSSDLIINNNFETLVEMIIKLAIGDSTVNLDYDITISDYNFETETETPINPETYFSGISINNNLVQWSDENEVTPYELLQLLQKAYCFYLTGDTSGNFILRGLPIMVNSLDFTLISEKYEDPEFFSFGEIRKLVNPIEYLDKRFYKSDTKFYKNLRKGVKIFDSANTDFEYEYRKDLEIDEIEFPANLNLSKFITPLKFEYDGSEYTLKSGNYSAYYRYYSYADYLLTANKTLAFKRVTGYNKTTYLFANEENEDTFTDPKNVRECSFNNNKYSVNCVIDEPVLVDNLRS